MKLFGGPHKAHFQDSECIHFSKTNVVAWQTSYLHTFSPLSWKFFSCSVLRGVFSHWEMPLQNHSWVRTGQNDEARAQLSYSDPCLLGPVMAQHQTGGSMSTDGASFHLLSSIIVISISLYSVFPSWKTSGQRTVFNEIMWHQAYTKLALQLDGTYSFVCVVCACAVSASVDGVCMNLESMIISFQPT